MKKQSKILLLAALLFTMTLQMWGQNSTQGKEFWVALTPGQAPEPGKDDPSKAADEFGPYLAISTNQATRVRISNPNTGWSIQASLAAQTWEEVRNIPNDQWYTTTSAPNTETPYQHGLKVEALDADVSVFCAWRWRESFDASNILPITALQSEYIIQTYPADSTANSFNGVARTVFSILAAEDCTVEIIPSVATKKGKAAKTSFSVSLTAGEVYHVYSAANQDLSGSRVKAQNGKRIAVFAGAQSNRIPNVSSDRDLLYEQLFPIDYWGREFIVARSAQRDANRIKITAQEPNTTVTIYGNYQPTAQDNTTLPGPYTYTLVNSGDSYEFEMSAGYDANLNNSNRKNELKGITILDSTVYITTSCPCAVLSYETGNSYDRGDGQTEHYYNGKNYGAPAMTWVSPLEQMLNSVVFGVMGTKMTTRHFVNIITRKENKNLITLNSRSLAAYFKPVDANSNYVYARIKLAETQPTGGQNPFYQLKGADFIATVYGNGKNESYAYSVGSSAIKRAIAVDGYKFTKDMTVDDVKQIFCVDKPLLFNPQIGTDVIDIVEWDFGDGTTATTTIDQGIEIEHTYYAPGWYDVTANVQAHKECPETTYPAEEVAFSFYVNRPDTLFRLDTVCLAPDDHSGESTFDTIAYDCDSIVITKNLVLHKADTTFDVEANDQYVYNGTTYTESQVIVDTRKRKDPENRGCDSTITINLTVHKCLNLQVPNDSANQHTCFGSSIDIPYSYATGGNAGNVRMVRLDDMREFEARMYDDPSQGLQPRTTGTFALSTNEWEPGLYHAKVYVEDLYCGGEAESDVLNIAIYYPSDIFEYRFNNVLAVFKKGFGGNGGTGVYQGADFDMYEWHLVRNEIDAIVGTNNGIYYNGDPFLLDDEVYVRLKETTKPYMLPSCLQIIKDVPDFTPEPQQAPAAQKKLINHRMVIIKDDRTYDMYGQRVQ